MRKTLLVAMTALAGQLFAGGFYLQARQSRGEPRGQDGERRPGDPAWTAATIPRSRHLTATAIGVVDGKRQTIPLEAHEAVGSRRRTP